MLCPKCGKSVDQLYSGLCVDCLFTEKKPIRLPEKLEVVVCGDCGAFFIGKHWEKLRFEEALKKLIRHSMVRAHGYQCHEIEINWEEAGRNMLRCSLKFLVEFEGASQKIECQTTVFKKRGVCIDCSRFHGHSFSAIIQIRRKGRRMDPQLLKEVEAIVRGDVSERRQIVKREEVENGLDLYILDNNYARSVCEELKHRYHAKVKASPKLHTRSEGREVYRVTYLVEFDRFEEGDLVYYNGELYTVKPGKGGKLIMQDRNGKERVVMEEHLKNVEIIEFEMLEEAKVVYRDEKEIMVLDESTMKLEKFENIDYPDDADRVWILKREDNIYLVPLRSVRKMRGETR